MSDFSRAFHFTLDLTDPVEREVGRMVRNLPRGHLKLWVLKMVSQRLGTDAAVMADRLRDDLLGNLEDGHKRDQAPKKDRLERPAPKSAPLGKPPKSEPLHKPAKDDEEPLRKAAPDYEQPDEGNLYV